MGRAFVLVFAVGVFFQTIANAGFNGLTSALAPALLGVAEGEVNNDYTKLLNLDSGVTVAISNGETLCTGTFITDEILITAAHCPDKNATTGNGNLNVEGIEALRVYYSDQWAQFQPSQDMAVVIFPKGTGSTLGIKKYPSISQHEMMKGDVLYFVGFGMQKVAALFGTIARDAAITGIRAWGTATVEKVTDGIVDTQPVSVNSAGKLLKDPGATAFRKAYGLPGDSGGAVYNELGEISALICQVKAETKTAPLIPGSLIGIFLQVEVNRKVSNRLIDLTTPFASELLKRAQDTEAKYSKAFLASVPKRPFEHLQLRTGFYLAKKKTTALLFVRPVYFEGAIRSVTVAKLETGKTPEVSNLKCDRTQECVDSKATTLLQFKGASFELSNLAPLEGNPLARKIEKIDDFDWTT